MRDGKKITLNQIRSAARTLELEESATITEIKSAYRRLARTYHPDSGKGGENPEMFHKISFAYEVLCEYARSYRIEFTEEAFLKMFPEEKLWKRFYSDPIWGPGRPGRDEDT